MNNSLITKKGFIKLKSEFDYLSQKERPKTVNGVAVAAAEGDRSENAEYIYGKKKLREIDKRLQYLSKLLKDTIIIDSSKVSTAVVSFGCKVSILDENNNKKTFTIVGEGESDLKDHSISYKAIVAKALLGKKIGEIAEVELQKGLVEYEILSIEVGDIE